MARVMYGIEEHQLGFDVSTNPEFILMTAEDEDAEFDSTESFWQAGLAVTKPKQSNDN